MSFFTAGSFDFDASCRRMVIFSKSTMPSLNFSNRIPLLPPGYTMIQSPAAHNVCRASLAGSAGQASYAQRRNPSYPYASVYQLIHLPSIGGEKTKLFGLAGLQQT